MQTNDTNELIKLLELAASGYKLFTYPDKPSSVYVEDGEYYSPVFLQEQNINFLEEKQPEGTFKSIEDLLEIHRAKATAGLADITYQMDFHRGGEWETTVTEYLPVWEDFIRRWKTVEPLEVNLGEINGKHSQVNFTIPDEIPNKTPSIKQPYNYFLELLDDWIFNVEDEEVEMIERLTKAFDGFLIKWNYLDSCAVNFVRKHFRSKSQKISNDATS